MTTTNPALADLTDAQLVTHLKGLRDRAATSTYADAATHFARLIDEVFIEMGQRVAAEAIAKEEAAAARLAQFEARQLAAKKARRKVDHHRKARETFKRIVRELGTTFEVSNDGYVEVAPWAGYPLGFTTLHHDWTETHERFEHALGDPRALSEDGYYTT